MLGNCGERGPYKTRISTPRYPSPRVLLTPLPRTGHQEEHTAQFFSGTNEDALKKRELLAEESLEMLISWLRKGGNVAIHGQYVEPCAVRVVGDVFACADATNSTKKRRFVVKYRRQGTRLMNYAGPRFNNVLQGSPAWY